mmetsp:Transcript_74745/g.155841  ORF Transcript_74745/g.155841 Transcript_74745/m.155841 type:complete len:87 (+) Transcript_74745:432-692(+)
MQNRLSHPRSIGGTAPAAVGTTNITGIYRVGATAAVTTTTTSTARATTATTVVMWMLRSTMPQQRRSPSSVQARSIGTDRPLERGA